MKKQEVFWTTHNGIPRLCLQDGSVLAGLQGIVLSAEAGGITSAKATFLLAGYVEPMPEQELLGKTAL